MLDPREGDRLDEHVAACGPCARFDTLARRALMVARNAPQLEVSADFSTRLAARIAEERRSRIAEHAPSHAERRLFVGGHSMVWVRRAAAVAAVVGGSMVVRGAMVSASSTTSPFVRIDSIPFFGDEGRTQLPASALSGMTALSTGNIVVVRSMRPVGGAIMPFSDDPLLDGSDRASLGDVSATSVAATAPLWPTALMAAHAANRFAAMEFGDVMPVSVMHTRR